ncbi:MAG: GTP-binding protein [Candidatus Lokiarchaeota archaeon]|nr:GTP-binding protein [Candidatus Lokiarchaeota archaeon]MBD3338945.1 GTP-binding protein [Candidatus Lokiarchaeota archaeon]
MGNNKFKICIIGDSGVGKTTLVNRYLTGVYKAEYAATIGVELYVKKINIDDNDITLRIWDFAGEMDFRFLLPNYIEGAAAAIYVYDLTRLETLKNLYEWLTVLEEASIDYKKDMPLIMVGAKLDLSNERVVTTEQAQKVAEKFGLKNYYECSSKTGENVENIFINVGKIVLSSE